MNNWRRAIAVLGLLSVAAPAWSADPNLAGTWWATEYYAKIPVVGGGAPPLNDAGKSEYASNRAGLKGGSLDDQTRSYCTPDAGPRLAATPYPFEIFQVTPGQVTFVHELNNQVRVVPLNRPLPSAETMSNLPAYEGYASARYDGAALVVESRGFNDLTFLDSSGLPHSDQLQTTERFTKVGDGLELVITIHDPALYARDWQARFAYQRRPGLRLQEYTCGGARRDISGVKGIPEIRAARAKGDFP